MMSRICGVQEIQQASEYNKKEAENKLVAISEGRGKIGVEA